MRKGVKYLPTVRALVFTIRRKLSISIKGGPNLPVLRW